MCHDTYSAHQGVEHDEMNVIVLGARNASFWLTHIEHGLTPDLLAAARCPVMTVC